MATFIIFAVLAVLCVYAGYVTYKKHKTGGGCCGEHEPPEVRIKVRDRNKSHYPHKAFVKVDGMVCINCACRVENALNVLPGTWASAELGEGRVLVRTKQPMDAAAIKEAIRKAGYTVMAVDLL